MEHLLDEGFVAVHAPADEVALVPPRFLHALDDARRQREDPMSMTFGLHVGSMTWEGGAPTIGARLGSLARAAEDVGFTRVSVMDHLIQIPQVGPRYADLTESFTTLGYLAGVTSRIGLGAMVTNVALRNPALVAKVVASLDVLSGGRAFCGLGAGWWPEEERLYGYPPLSVGDRFDRLEAALRLLPALWGPGADPPCYPRPLQARVPIVVGGGGERRTLRLVAEHADECNLQGEPDVVARKVAVLRGHCAAVGRDPATVGVTHLGEAAVLVDGGERYDACVGTVEELIGRYRALADAGVQHCVVALHNDGTPAAVEAFAPVIDAFDR